MDELSAIDIDGTDIQFGVGNEQVGLLTHGNAAEVRINAGYSRRR